ncbi:MULTISPECIES: D-glycero-alpha-D-manno-heptose-1,7-bisphosphate 7-phosphatase [Phyllobacteriaceae]|jgi:D-glycero-D-manno-heptose 1,7-bisphosphate phosphatase|uniref:D,D-heptose 1,7-bisphosphate phosphatase n=1 Tax=Mesorhizobium hungaricum TaxID=1566387 RepID=A0A1C2ECX1_9HYPH|nr:MULTISPECIES: HAD-IIIA family hydrolase [Mesorhizobium]MBN9237473.1 HAD-IIIA family hydrolase [Mesorhizobium sp.]MDQ0329000.1 D-glycero-D-manno-heptose 1,7-bisphosphate phosphatase [Mesorhizobium sp. YL-MeA3-2017]OCX24720.1 HAD family hydrolase [Mesorhizobium hungaricum]
MTEDAVRFPLAEPGLWVERVGDTVFPSGEPALFLDRDGTINVDTGYPSNAGQVVLREEIVPVIQTANSVGLPVVVVTNQSGIARGYFGWAEFAAVNGRVLELLHARHCSVDLVLACAYHEAGNGLLGVADHPMRKPNPGMLLRAAEILKVDLAHSLVVGDKQADAEAGRRAGLSKIFLVGGAVSAEQAAIAEMETIRRL